MAQIASTTPEQAQSMVLYDVRAVHDVAALGWIVPAARPGQWTIAKITADPDSGKGTVPGAYIDASTGRFVAPAGASLAAHKRGTWTVIAGGNEPAGTTHRYDWTEPIQRSGRTLQPEDLYSPFADGGVILFRPGETPGAAGFFQDVVLLFPEWSADAANALAYVYQHPSIARLPADNPGVEEVRGIMRSGNRLLTVAAIAQLSSGGHLSRAEIEDIVLRGEPQLAATLTYCLLMQGSAVEPWIERASRADQLRWMAVGAVSVDVFGKPVPGLDTAARSALVAVRDRLARLGREPDSDAYLQALFDLVKLGK
jgi:hypothetical protein